MKGRAYERVVCPGCARTISAYAPHTSEGRELMVVAHNRVAVPHRIRRGEPCPAAQRRIVYEGEAWRLA